VENLNTSSETAPKALKHEIEGALELRALFVDELKNIYLAEIEITKTMLKIIKNPSSEEFLDVFANHLEHTKSRVKLLEKIFECIGEIYEEIVELNEEAEEKRKENELDIIHASIIQQAKNVKFHKISCYGNLLLFAKTLGEEKAAYLLEETLNNDKNRN